MRKFKVLKCPQEKTVSYVKHGKNADGSRYGYTVYKEVKVGEKDLNGELWYPGAYGHRKVKEGDVLEIAAPFAEKAAMNPDFEEVKEVVKKKRGRPPKVKADAS